MTWLFVLLVASVSIIVILARCANFLLVRLLGNFWFNVVLWPGVVVHELSHMLGAIISRTPIHDFSLFPEQTDEGELLLGKVIHEHAQNPIARVAISIFPLIGGIGTISGMAYFIFPALFTTSPILVEYSAGELLQYGKNLPSFAKTFFFLFNPSFLSHWIFLYLTIAISTHIAPSSHDLRYALSALLGTSLVAIILILAWHAINNALIQTTIQTALHRALLVALLPINYTLTILVFVIAVACVVLLAKQYITHKRS